MYVVRPWEPRRRGPGQGSLAVLWQVACNDKVPSILHSDVPLPNCFCIIFLFKFKITCNSRRVGTKSLCITISFFVGKWHISQCLSSTFIHANTIVQYAYYGLAIKVWSLCQFLELSIPTLLPQRDAPCVTDFRAGQFRNFLIFSIIKNYFFAFFIKLITYSCTSPT